MSKSRTKKIISVIMVAVMVLTMGIFQVASLGSTRAESDPSITFTVDELQYTVTSTIPAEVAVAGLADGSPTTDITIPSEVTSGAVTYSVTSIGSSAFERTAITSIFLPQSVTSIGGGAFNNCTKLTEVTIENTDAESKLETIGNYAFRNTAITSIVIPQNVKTIGVDAFYYCMKLAEVTMENTDAKPSKLETIGFRAFTGSGITSIVLPQSVTSIGGNAFMHCSQLAEVTIENTKAPSKLETIGNDAFNYTAITSIDIPQSVKIIGGGAFFHCEQLAKVTIENTDAKPSKLETIWDNAFYKSGITSIVIPQSVKIIGVEAFNNCAQLAEVTIENTDAKPSKLETIGVRAFTGSGITSIVIPQSVTSIGGGAFAWCSELNTIVFSGVTVPTFGVDLFYEAEKDITAYVPFAQKEQYKTAFEAEPVLEGYDHTLTVLGHDKLVMPVCVFADAPILESGYSESIVATGGIEGETVTYKITDGALPIGLILNADGTITGTSTKLETATFTVTAKVANVLLGVEYSAEKEYTINVVDKIAPTLEVVTEAINIEINGATSVTDFIKIAVKSVGDNIEGEVKVTTDFETVVKQETLKDGIAVKIIAEDESGNKTTKTVVVNVTDTLEPVLSIKNSEVTIEINGNMTEADFLKLVVITKSDNSKGEVKIITNFDAVLQNAVGEKTVKIIAEDASGNKSTEITVTVKVTDTIAPTLTIKNKEVTIELNGNITEADFLKLVGVTTTDNSKGEVKIITDFDTVAQNALGEKTVKIVAEDASGNKSTETTVTVKVTDTLEPVFNIKNKEVTIELNGNITEADFLKLVGVTTTDNSDADVKTRTNNAGVAITTNFASVKQNVLGKTTVTITATDASGNVSTEEVTVNVTDTTPEPITEPTTEEPTTVTPEPTTGAGTDVATGDSFTTPLFFIIALFSVMFILACRKKEEELQS